MALTALKGIWEALTLFYILAVTFISCTSAKLPKAPAPDLDYTQKDVHDAEVQRIYDMMQKSPVEAMWRACVLGDKELCGQTADFLCDALKSHIQEDDRLEAFTIYNSLVTTGFADKAASVMSAEKMHSFYFDGVPGIDTAPSRQLPVISDYITGTVTIWVDLGIKIQRGMGYADRVIGSGFFIDPRGYLVTNHHVIKGLVDPKNTGYGKLYIKMAENSEQKIPAKLIGYDSVHDIALLKTEIEVPYVFNLGSSRNMYVGTQIYAIGSPLGLERTLTSGVVSATDRKLFTTGNVVQIDAAINFGNSGGPCIDKNGTVQGIVFAGIMQYQGLNFAIPIEYLKQDLPILYRGGQRHFPWLAACGRTAKAGRTEYGLEVHYIKPGSTMARAGMKVGDIITMLDGKKIVSLESVQDVLRDHVPGTIISCTYLEGGSYNAKRECLLYLTERPKNPGYDFYEGDTIQNSFTALFGMTLVPSSTKNSKTFVVTKIIPGSIADEYGFSENDPVTVGRIQFNNEKSAVMIIVTTQNRRNGYLDANLVLQSALDSTYYF